MAKAKRKATPAKTVDSSTVASTPKTSTIKKGTSSKKAILDEKNVKTTVKQVVKSQREIKYKYPAEVDNQLDRKGWRQKTRNKDNKFKAKIAKMAKAGNPDLHKEEIKYGKFRKEHYLVP